MTAPTKPEHHAPLWTIAKVHVTKTASPMLATYLKEWTKPITQLKKAA